MDKRHSITMQPSSLQRKGPKLEIVLKCDSIGSLEAVTTAISQMGLPESEIAVIRSGVGSVTKSDVLMAETASRLILGFQVAVMPDIEKLLREYRIEVRLYHVIYQLTADIRAIAETLVPPVSEEQIIGSAKVIALFKSVRRGIILGCEVTGGFFALGQHFRIISAMGPVYSGIVESLHIGDKAVQKAVSGQQVGIKIAGFNKAKTGDLVESFRLQRAEKAGTWEPTGGIINR